MRPEAFRQLWLWTLGTIAFGVFLLAVTSSGGGNPRLNYCRDDNYSRMGAKLAKDYCTALFGR